ncbi:MAG: geranylgeranylglyceryl/heptaprenylglyceryl phosphate synthase [Saprospiraceae bacterium]|nr:geranylgeranylglyceryl/heptaprenylglyceryl phosphate synthase [Saprospiraceae bacterium]MBL0293405.1 geranylgeranylglyceryl/heptaprenylglyceryl phosphate synthase [Saprospiraceae bacterium]
MTSKGIYEKMQQDLIDQQKRFVVLLDPDKIRLQNLDKIIKLANETKVDYFFIGGSLVVNDVLDSLLMDIKKECNIPLILFPGNSSQLSYKADGLLFLSLISGRNADLLIGKHVVSAPFLKISPLEILSTGYMLIDGGVPTTVSYISNTYPIPSNKEDIAVCTAIAGEMLGLKLIFMDAGSGAEKPVSTQMIESVKGAIQIPLIVGGGIKTAEKVRANIEAGADIIVVGDAIEKDPQLIRDMALATKS